MPNEWVETRIVLYVSKHCSVPNFGLVYSCGIIKLKTIAFYKFFSFLSHLTLKMNFVGDLDHES